MVKIYQNMSVMTELCVKRGLKLVHLLVLLCELEELWYPQDNILKWQKLTGQSGEILKTCRFITIISEVITDKMTVFQAIKPCNFVDGTWLH